MQRSTAAAKTGRAGGIALCLLLATSIGAQPLPTFRGLTLEAAIAEIQASGLTVYYSSDLVKRGMRIREEPPPAPLPDLLDSLLEPFGLMAAPGPADSVLIVRGPAAAGESHAATETARAALDIPAANPLPIEELIVAASRYELVRAADASARLTSADLEYSPDLGDDALRAVHRLPGAATNGLSARANVRGGEAGETLVRFDGLRLYDPFHLEDFQGVFSTVDPEIVSTIDVYTGGFPAIFGDRLSGVIDITSMAAPADRYSELAVSFFNTSALTAGRFAGGDGEWLASIRRSNLDLLYNAFSPKPERPRYFDTFARLAYDVSDELRLTFGTLRFRDDVALNDDVDLEEQAFSEHEDRYLWARLDHTLGAFTGASLVARASLSGHRAGTTAKEGIARGSLDDHRRFDLASLQSEWSWRRSDRLLVQFGGALDRARGSYAYRDDVEFDVLFAAPGAPVYASREREIRAAPRGHHYAFYGSLRYSPAARLTADVGLRWDKQTLEPANSSSLSPRLGLRYRIAERSYVMASWGRFFQSQAINELQASDGVVEFFAPQESEQTMVGFEHDFPRGLNFRIEAYRKDMSRLHLRHENLLNTLTLLPELQPDRIAIAPDGALARGIELSARQRLSEELLWWAAYSRASAEDRIGTIDVPRSWDQTDAWSAGVNWDGGRWNIGFGLTYRTGWPTTAIVLDATGALPVIQAGNRNMERVGSFGSADLRITRTFELDGSTLDVFAEVSNVFDRGNPCCTEYQVEDGGTPSLDLSRINYLPRVPSLGFVWSF
jgi:outer membrane cobalamin receptor